MALAIQTFQMESYLTRLPNETSLRVSSIGRTNENRTLYMATVGSPTATKTVWLDAGIHAREQSAAHVAFYVLEKVVAFLKEYQFC